MIPLRDNVPSQNTPWMTWLLIAVNLFVFRYQSTLSQEPLMTFLYQHGFIPLQFSQMLTEGIHPRIFSLSASVISSLFLHGSWLHLVSNMWSLWLFGDNVEDSVGPVRFLLFYLAGGITAAMVHFLFNPLSPLPVIGASGAIAAVMGAYLIMFPMARVVTLVPILFIPVFFQLPALLFIGFWFISQVFSGFISLAIPSLEGGIAWWAHIGGFLFGVLFIPFIRKQKWQYRCFYEDGHYHCRYD